MNDPRLINMAQAIANVSAECIGAGVAPEAVVSSVCDGLGKLLVAQYSPEQAAALLRMEAGKIEATIVRAKTVGADADAQEGADLMRKGHEFINALQVAGLEEPVIVSSLLLVLVERVARTNGVAGAAGWLNRMAAVALSNGDNLGRTSQAH